MTTNNLDLNAMGLASLSEAEMKEVDGGFLPLVAIGFCWGLMAVADAMILGAAHSPAAR